MVDENPTLQPQAQRERRRHERLRLSQPLRTSLGGAPGYVIDASIGGLGIMHNARALAPGANIRVRFYSPLGPITIDCEVARTGPHQNLGRFSEEGAWHSGLRIMSIDAESDARLRRLMMTLTEH